MLEGMAYGGLASPGTSYPVPDVGNVYLVWNDNVFALIRILVWYFVHGL